MVALGGLSLTAEEADNERQWAGHASVKGPKWARMFLLTVCLLGLQMTWSIEMSYAFPYLLTMGVSKALMSLVLVAGPLSGLVVQPLIGVFADRSKSRWGRRRPFMLAGCMISIGSLLLLGFTRNFASLLVDATSNLGQSITICLATLSIYLLDFSINAVQAMDRALLVDTLPATEQELGNAWAARLMGLGGLLGFFTGYMDLVTWFPFLGRTQLQVLVIIGSVILLGTHILTSLCVTERVLIQDDKTSGSGFLASMRDIWSNMRTLPPKIRQICVIQFFNWIAWFPILFYSSEWVGEIYTRSQVVEGRSAMDPAVVSEAMRIGSEALFWQSTVVLTSIVLLPILVGFAEGTLLRRGSASHRRNWSDSWLSSRLLRIFSLPYLWAVCHLLFAVMMFLTLFIDSVWGASCIMAVLGIPSAVNNWAPFSLLGEVIQSEAPLAGEEYALEEQTAASTAAEDAERAVLIASTDDDDMADTYSLPLFRSTKVYRVNDPGKDAEQGGTHVLHVDLDASQDEIPHKEGNNLSEKAGIILGIHNIFVVIPQFLVNGLSALVFALLAPRPMGIHDSTADSLGASANATLPSIGATSPAPVRDIDSIGVVLRYVTLCC
ncbi:hypothetical protein CALCODRAFT_431195 [Calocera cornea HHB12733]|uniref:MFS general substrate transporter n=1 Tax=Calocera cornea HHB12733 TaxID=1353952 RepID=A0A165HGJ6_9BASI|nr:hypothetical protein CALCODRAFT_431195 [Calocera cornea HHB12733]